MVLNHRLGKKCRKALPIEFIQTYGKYYIINNKYINIIKLKI